MKQGLELQELAAELQRQAEAKQDYVADTRQMTVLPILAEADNRPQSAGAELHMNEIGEFFMRPTAHNQVSDRLAIPKKFYDRLLYDHPSLWAHNVNTLFRERPERRMVRTLDGKARAFLSDRYRRLDNLDLAEVILPILGEMPDVRFESCALTETRMYIKAVLPRVEGEVKVGEAVQAGVVITNSEVGHGSLGVFPMVFTLVCRNGMVLPDRGTRKFHVGRQVGEGEEAQRVYRDETIAADDKAFFMKVADVVRAAVDEAQFLDVIKQLRAAREREVMKDPIQGVERLANRFSMTDTEKRGVLTHLVRGGDLSAYGAINAVTRASQDCEDYDRASDFERFGGEILTMPQSEWKTMAAAV